MSDQFQWINARERFAVPPRRQEPPKLDLEASKAAGKPVAVNDPRLIKAVAKWKKEDKAGGKPEGEFDNFLQSGKRREELRKIFN